MASIKRVKRLSNGKIEYNGEVFSGFNSPKKDTKTKHKEVVLAKKGDEVKLVRYGHEDYGHNYSAEARKSYLARSAKIKDKNGNLTKDDKFSANHWARKRLWAGPGKSKKAPPKK